jgi:hypothetical protein
MVTAACECQAVYAGEDDSVEGSTFNSVPPLIDDVPSCFRTLKTLKETTLMLAQRHRAHVNFAASHTQLGTK